MASTSHDVIGENHVCNQAGELVLTDEDKINGCYAMLLNVEFVWLSEELRF